jgi:hypothetical protein
MSPFAQVSFKKISAVTVDLSDFTRQQNFLNKKLDFIPVPGRVIPVLLASNVVLWILGRYQ